MTHNYTQNKEKFLINYFSLNYFMEETHFMENLREKEYCKQKITELVEKIDNPAILIKILSFIEAWMEE